MQAVIPQIEEDQIICCGRRKRHRSWFEDGKFQHIFPKKGNHQLRAIQTTTAAPLVQAAHYYLNNPTRSTLQSQINSEKFQRKLYRTRVRQNKTN
jgi:hypothetical protein